MSQLRHPTPDQLTLTAVLGALGDPVRLSIVTALADGREHGWGDLDAGVALSTLSHHVRVLREAGVINHRKEGTRCFVSLRPDLNTAFPGLLPAVLRCSLPDRRTASPTPPSPPAPSSPSSPSIRPSDLLARSRRGPSAAG